MKNRSSEQPLHNVLKAVNPMATTPNEQFLQSLRERSAQAFTEAAAETRDATPPIRSGILWRTIMHNRTLRFAAAAAVVFAVLLGSRLFVTTESSAYADVVQMLQEARTLAYTLVTQVNDGSGKEITTEWLYKDPAYLRTETEGGHVTVIDGVAGRQMSIVPENRTWMEGDFHHVLESNPEGEDPFAVIARLRALPAQADEDLGEKQIEIHTVRGFRVTTGDASTTVWIDVETREPVQVEHGYANAPGMNSVMKAIRLDLDLDDSLFAMTPPEGYSRISLDAGTGGSEAQFVEFLRYWAEELTKDHTFPPVVLGPQMSKVMVDMAMQGKFHQEKVAQLVPNEMYQALLWLAALPKSTNWRYLGENMTYGNPDQPIFWYLPEGHSIYRVVYADMSIREVLPEDLPR
jgi:outer membrane lipoprotein-sorting protein